MNFLWAGMIIVGIIYGALTGNLAAITQASLDSTESAVSLCITMLGVMAFWMGLMEIATKAGIIEALSKKMQPLVSWLFPEVPNGSKAQEYITTNMIANILGLGWAATPAGLRAMEELAILDDVKKEKIKGIESRKKHSKKMKEGKEEGAGSIQGRVATNEMCTLLVLNISSLQLIPINIIAYRSEYGSVNPTAILAPAIVATAVSTVVGVAFCKMKKKQEK